MPITLGRTRAVAAACAALLTLAACGSDNTTSVSSSEGNDSAFPVS